MNLLPIAKIAPLRLKRLPSAGFSLLEVVVGMVIVGLILVPTTAFMCDVMKGDATQRIRGEMIHMAHGKQDELRQMARLSFNNRTQRGTFAAQGQPQMRYTATCSQAPANGGVSNRLMAISTLAYDDANNNRRLDTGEASIQLWTAVARATP